MQRAYRRYRNKINVDEDEIDIKSQYQSVYSLRKKENDEIENYQSFKRRTYYSNTIHSIDLEIDESKILII